MDFLFLLHFFSVQHFAVAVCSHNFGNYEFCYLFLWFGQFPIALHSCVQICRIWWSISNGAQRNETNWEFHYLLLKQWFSFDSESNEKKKQTNRRKCWRNAARSDFIVFFSDACWLNFDCWLLQPEKEISASATAKGCVMNKQQQQQKNETN